MKRIFCKRRGSQLANIYEHIYNTLAPLGYPVKEQGSYGPGAALPETFITYQVIDAPNNTHYDNLPASTTSRIQLAIYSARPDIKQSGDSLLKSVMLPAGFLRVSGRDLPFDREVKKYGYTSDYKFYESED